MALSLLELIKQKANDVLQSEALKSAIPILQLPKIGEVLTRKPGAYGQLDPGSFYGGFVESREKSRQTNDPAAQNQFAMETAMDFLPGIAATTKAQTAIPQAVERFFARSSRKAPSFIASPEGIVSKVTKGGPNAKRLFSELEPTILPSSGEILGLGQGAVPKLLDLPSLTLPISKVRKLIEEGGNISKVQVFAKDANEAREALKLGVPSSQVLIRDAKKMAGETAQKWFGGKLGITKSADQAKELLDKTVETALKPGDTYAPKGPVRKTVESLFGDTSVKGSKGIIEKAGDAGKMITTLLEKADLEGSRLAGEATLKLQNAFKGLGKQELDTFADVVEGRAAPISDLQAQAVTAWREIAEDVQRLAKEAGVDMGIIENYFPHKTLELSPEQMAAYAEELVSKGNFKTVAEAMQALQKEVTSLPRNAARRYGNLELSRTSKLPYDTNPGILFDYIKNAYGRIADVKNFGTKDEILYKLAKAAGTQGGDAAQISQYLDQILGKNQVASKIGQKLTSLQTITKLNPTTSLTNLTQNLSTWLRTDTPTMAKTMVRVITNPKEAFARAIRVGEISPNLAKELADYTGGSKAASKWIRLIGMQGTEKFNRVMAVNAGMDYAEKIAKQAFKGSKSAIRELERFGIGLDDIDEAGKLTEEALLTAGKKLSKATQFATEAGELPYAWRTEAGKVITQFKSFAYKQSGFVKGEAGRIASETKQGNIKPLINALTVFGIAAPVAGEIVADFKSLVKNKKREDVDTLTERYFNNILNATSFGLLDSVGALTGQYGSGGIISTLGGPTISDAEKIISGVADVSAAAQGKDVDLKPVARDVVKSIPVVGQTLSNTLIPNSYVDNYIGPNEGMSADNVEKYRALQSTDPAAAERFKAENQQRNQPQEGTNIVQKLFGGQPQFDWNQTPTTKKGKSAFNTQVDTALENGAEVPEKALNTRFFEGKTYKGSNSEKEKVLKDAMKVLDDEFLTEEQKQQIVATAKIDPKDLSYYQLASLSPEDKIQGMVEFAASGEADHNELIQTLALNKRRVAGAYITTPAVLDRLYDEGYISKQEKALLTAIKWDSVYNKFYIDRDYKGGGSGTVGGTGLTLSQIKSYINSVNSIFKSSNVKQSKKSTQDILPKAPKALTFQGV